MFKFSKPRPPEPGPARSIRDTLFGDVPLSEWPPGVANDDDPWNSFIRARDALAAGRSAEAIACWQHVTTLPELESRHHAQAWHFLRSQGVQPPADRAKELLGVVLEVPVEGGLDLLAAYPERTARYYNFSGAGVVWEHPDASLDEFIDAFLHAGQRVLNAIGPWDQPRPPAPPLGQVRLNVISPAGLHFGQSTFANFNSDPMAKPLIDAGVALMQQLIGESTQRRA